MEEQEEAGSQVFFPARIEGFFVYITTAENLAKVLEENTSQIINDYLIIFTCHSTCHLFYGLNKIRQKHFTRKS
jgi:hypothetical protein